MFGGTLTYPVLRSRQQSQNAYASFDAIESETRTNASSTLSRQRCGSLRILCFGKDDARSDILPGPNHPAVNAVSFRISHGLHAFGAEANGARGGFLPHSSETTERTKIACEINRTQTLFNPWQGASLALMDLVTGQWSDDVLLPVEQSYLGGSRFTRGDYAGQIVGDCRPWSVPSMAMYAPR